MFLSFTKNEDPDVINVRKTREQQNIGQTDQIIRLKTNK